MMNTSPPGEVKRRRRVTPEEAARIRELRLQGMSVAETARQTGFSESVVHKTGSAKPLTPENEAIAQRLIAGESQTAIARSMDPAGRGLGKDASRISGVFKRLVAEGRITDHKRTAVSPQARPTALDAVIGSHRDAVLAYLREHDGEATTGRTIAQALGTSIHKVEAAIDSLRKAGQVSASKQGKDGKSSSNRLHTSVSGDHEQWFEVRLAKAVAINGNGTTAASAEAAKVAREINDAKWRDAILNVLARADAPFGETSDLRAALRHTNAPVDQFFELQQLLGRMEVQGLVRFRRDRVAKRTVFKRITVTEAGARAVGVQLRVPVNAARHATDGTDPRNHGAFAEGGPIERRYIPPVNGAAASEAEPVVPAPEPVAAEPAAPPEPEPAQKPVETIYDWPILAGLRQRLFRANARAQLLKQAAELADDSKEREELELYAASAATPTLSAVEKEYMAFAERTDV